MGPFYLKGVQGAGVVAAVAIAPALLAGVVCLAKPFRMGGWITVLSGAVAFLVCAANLVATAVRTLVQVTVSGIELASSLGDGAGGAALAIQGAVLLPADLFVLAVTSGHHVPAFMDGLETATSSANRVMENLDTLAALPRIGIGLTLCTATALLTIITGCFMVRGSRVGHAATEPRFKSTPSKS